MLNNGKTPNLLDTQLNLNLLAANRSVPHNYGTLTKYQLTILKFKSNWNRKELNYLRAFSSNFFYW
ncbi:MAG: hypothetical protein ACJAT4_001717 [Granulosicoccus sp.]|jgi:hypothetical protein